MAPRKILTLVTLSAAFLLVMSGNVAAQETYAQESLRGFDGIHVVVSPFEDEERDLGLSERQINADVELRLRGYGVRVLTEEEWLLTP